MRSNVRNVELTGDVGAHGRFELTVNARACGPRLGGDTQKVIRAVKAGEWERGPAGSGLVVQDTTVTRVTVGSE